MDRAVPEQDGDGGDEGRGAGRRRARHRRYGPDGPAGRTQAAPVDEEADALGGVDEPAPDEDPDDDVVAGLSPDPPEDELPADDPDEPSADPDEDDPDEDGLEDDPDEELRESVR